ncbi:pyridoxal phosphate-dependent decarboxylase family protein [Streptomyces sp. NPDC006879]|uniref:pyridoxal phosphate-dependent decarboxylase family protein n=1 Tax=Streptomyces sp. NPDC006879 TaxID=3364767 RepID=UPI0036A85025
MTAPPAAGPRSQPGPPPPLAGGPTGPAALRPLLTTALRALQDGALTRDGPLPAGGPENVNAALRSALGTVLPDQGTGAEEALTTIIRTLAEGSADPADPRCAAHLHCPPLALAVVADLAASALNPSLDSWDQAPAASALEALLTRALAAEILPRPATITADAPDAVLTTGGTEANQLALLLAREHHGPVRLVCGTNAHHSLPRAAWLLGLPQPLLIPTPTGTLDPGDLDEALAALPGPTLVAATAGTTEAGLIDPLPAIAARCARHGARLHVDAAYGGPLLFSPRHRHRLDGLDRAHSVTVDLHKLGWQPVAAGLLAVPSTRDLAPLDHRADYLNAADDTEAGLPDLLGRSLRTTRRPDVVKIATTLRALGRDGLAQLIDRTCRIAEEFADLIEAHPRFELHRRPGISTVLFRPRNTTDEQLGALRRTLLMQGRAVLGRSHSAGRLWLKATLLNPHTTQSDLHSLVQLLELPEGSTR